MKAFRHLGNAQMVFGAGQVNNLINYLPGRGPLLVVTGRHLAGSVTWKNLENRLQAAGIAYTRETVDGEPSPEMIAELTARARSQKTESIAAIGGGSVLDAGKAAAAMLKHEHRVEDYLEGVGERSLTGAAVPVIAAPTTAGTGSEATKNAVISRRGKGGFKRSLRHDAFIPRTAIIDPVLAVGCPPMVSLACGMDALCQLLESFISTDATPLTRLLARDGLLHFGRGSRLFSEQCYGGADELELRGELALAAYFSGLALANAGLGTVHGLAGPLGALSRAPHGVVCGLLLGPVFRRLVRLLGDSPEGGHTLRALESAGTALFPGETNVDRMLDKCESWADALPRLSSYGLSKEDLDAAVTASTNKSFPVRLSEDDRRAALAEIY